MGLLFYMLITRIEINKNEFLNKNLLILQIVLSTYIYAYVYNYIYM